MIQTFSFPRKRAISELSTSLQLPTQTIFTQCKWCAVRVHQQPRGLHLAIQPKRFLNTKEGSQTQRSFCERKDDGNRGSRHKPNSPGAGGAGSVLFSSFFARAFCCGYRARFQMSGLRAGYTSVNIWQYPRPYAPHWHRRLFSLFNDNEKRDFP